MHLMIRDSQGRVVESLLLAVSKYRMRVQTRGAVDVAELTLEFGDWTLQPGQKVELEFVSTADWLDATTLCSRIFPRVRAAGEMPEYS